MPEKVESYAVGWQEKALVLLSLLVYALSFLHLRADFPNHSPWMDWSKMTDEGWYGGAAIHHFITGNWYVPGSFNPAVAMPVWPAMLGAWFALTGVSMLAARALTMLLYGASLVLLYRITWLARPGRLAGVVVLLTVINPFCYAFNRLAVLEPVTVFFMMLAFWLAAGSATAPRANSALAMGRYALLGFVILLLVLTKATGVALVPAVLYLLWARWGWPGWRRIRRSHMAALALIAGTTTALWLGYFKLWVKPRYLADYRLLFNINAYRVHLTILPRTIWVTVLHGRWFNPWLFSLALIIAVLSGLWLRELWRVPLFGAAVIAIAGHLAYITYHTNFQPRYYVVIAMPLILVVGFGAVAMRDRRREAVWRWSTAAISGLIAVVSVAMLQQTMNYVLHPEYSFWDAAQGIAAIIHADEGRSMILSDSGDELSLWTGLPAVCEVYTTGGLDPILDRYQPAWFAAWAGWEDTELSQVSERYHLNAVAQYRIFDDARRQILVLYKLTPRPEVHQALHQQTQAN